MSRTLYAALVLAATAAAPAFAARIEVGPYLQNARADGVTVIWESDAPTGGALVVATPAGERRFPSPNGTHHEVRAAGLAPGRYRYHVEAGDAQSHDAELQTAVAGDSFTFLVYGDNRDRDYEHAQVITAMAGEHADLALQTGDMTGDAALEALWRRFFAIESPLVASVPMYPTIGNHELLNDPGLVHYHRLFAPPELAPGEPDNERYYSFRYANALFVALDGNQSHSAAQAAWLVRTLDAAAGDRSIAHTFVFFHQPPFSNGDICGSAAEQGLWVPELERRGVRAVFAGHDHSYQHLERNGVRYFVTGGGGAPLHKESTSCPEYDRHALTMYRAAYHYLRVRIRGAEAALDAIAADGQMLEQVKLHEPAPPHDHVEPAVPFDHLPATPTGARRPLVSMPIVIVAVGLLGTVVIGLGLYRRRSR